MKLTKDILRYAGGVALVCAAAVPAWGRSPQLPQAEGGDPLSRRVPRHAPAALPAAQPRGTFQGVVASFQGIMTKDQHYFADIDAVTGEVSPIFYRSNLASAYDYDIQGGAIRDGILYVPEFAGASIVWHRFDLARQTELSPIDFGNNEAAYAYSIAYDQENDLFHILSLDPTSFAFGLYCTVDPNNDFELKQYGLPGMGVFLGSIVWNPADKLVYAFDQYNMVYTIDPDLQTLVEMGTVDEDYAFIMDKTTTPMTYSPLDRSFVAFFPDVFTESIKLLFIDDETFSVTESASLYPANPYLSMLYCTDPYAPLEAPETPAAPEVLFDGPALSGSVVITAPSRSYGGLALEGEVRMVLTLDGETIYDNALAPGASATVSVSGEEGAHPMTLRAWSGDNASPLYKTLLSIGNDVPMAPEGLAVDGSLVTWQPVGGVGANNGYVDAQAVTYDIYENGAKLNASPLTGCSYTLDADRQVSWLEIAVTATANGKTSEAAVTTTLLGEARALPLSMRPTADEFKLFQVLDADGDGNRFKYDFDQSEGKWYVTLDLTDKMGRADDWVFLPLMAFATPDQQYELSFTYRNYSFYEAQESLEVCIGDAATPEAMTQVLYSNPSLRHTDDTRLSARFAVAGAGDRYIGFHCTSLNSYGIRLADFEVKCLEGTSSHAPAAPEVNLVPAPKGGLSVDVEIAAPSLDLVGEPLQGGDAITYTVACGHETASVSVEPGTSATVTLPVAESGNKTVTVVGANSRGEGIATKHTAYVGVDRPLAPRNITYRTSDDNKSVTVSWEAPGFVGENGGYVDSDNLEYVIYSVEGVSFNPVGLTTELSYTYTVPVNDQRRYMIGPAARNEIDESRYSKFLDNVLGTPNVIPLTEEFSSTGFSFDPVWNNMGEGFSDSAVEATATLEGMGTGAMVDMAEGGLVVYNTGMRPTNAEIVFPKVSTAGSKTPAFRLRWLDWKYTPVFSLWARRAGAEELVCLAEFEPQRPARGEWVDSELPLTDGFEDASWVEFRVHAALSTEIKEYGYIDSYALFQMVDHDIKVASIDGPSEAIVGDEVSYTVRVLNAGYEVMTGDLTTTVKGADGTVIYETTDNIKRLQALRDYQKIVRLNLDAEALAVSPLTITATVATDEDEVPDNNTLSVRLDVKAHEAPIVGDLRAERLGDGNDVTLTWSEPALTYGGDEGFEMAEPFVHCDKIGVWSNYDRDQLPVYGIDGLNWDGNEDPRGWIAVNAETLRLMNDERLCPHSGKQYLMARTCQYDEDAPETMVQASDWLVSPEVVGGTEVTFWFGTISTDYIEYIEIWWSAEEPWFDPYVPAIPDEEGFLPLKTVDGSWRKLQPFDKSGEEAWEFVRFQLPEQARYFAIRYSSVDSFGALLDDITYTPVQLFTWDLDGYRISRTVGDVEQTIATGVKETTWVDTTGEGAAASYNVFATVLYNGVPKDGPRSNTAHVGETSVDGVVSLAGVSGGRGEILAEGLEGCTLAVYGMDGMYAGRLDVTSPRQSFAFAPGIWIVKYRDAYTKIMVK